MIVCLDSFALLTWLKNEPGAATVDALLNQSAASPDDRCYVALLNLCEVYYRLLRLKGQADADEFWQQSLTGLIPVTVVSADEQRALLASRIKGAHPVAFGDAFAIQLAMELQAPLATGDPEIVAVHAKIGLTLIQIP